MEFLSVAKCALIDFRARIINDGPPRNIWKKDRLKTQWGGGRMINFCIGEIWAEMREFQPKDCQC